MTLFLCFPLLLIGTNAGLVPFAEAAS